MRRRIAALSARGTRWPQRRCRRLALRPRNGSLCAGLIRKNRLCARPDAAVADPYLARACATLPTGPRPRSFGATAGISQSLSRPLSRVRVLQHLATSFLCDRH